MIAIIDYGMGNLRSVQKAFEFAGYEAVVTSDADLIRNAEKVVLPGVGAIADAVAALDESGLIPVIKEAAETKPFLGICLGMQLLFDRSMENGVYDCLGIIPGEVVRFDVHGLKVPHMGWNNLKVRENPIITGEPYVYFVHSYHAAKVPEEYILATAEYGYEFVAAVRKGNVYGLQFHPEKSGDFGIEIIKKFGGLKP